MTLRLQTASTTTITVMFTPDREPSVETQFDPSTASPTRGTIRIIKVDNLVTAEVATSVDITTDGAVSVDLDPGNYEAEVQGARAEAGCERVSFEVKASERKAISVLCRAQP